MSALKLLINKEALKRLSQALGLKFDPDLNSKLDPLELKERVYLVRDELYRLLPKPYPQALKILVRSLKTGNLKGFDLWPYTEFVQTYGLSHVELSLEALKEITKLFTSEWGVRPFLIHHQDRTLRFLEACAQDKDVNVRRWASEGSRPRLPWGERLKEFVKDPRPTEKILDQLKFDEELFVRKSVANHLNDIAKDHPDYVVKTLRLWKKSAPPEHRGKIDWIIRHSLRTLIKSGHAEALGLLGVGKLTEVELSELKIHKKKIRLGEKMDFEFSLVSLSKKPQKLVVDYVIHFMKSNSQHSAKVFKLKTFELSPLAEIQLRKSHHIKQITTRQYYSGLHKLEIQVNGKVMGLTEWKLDVG